MSILVGICCFILPFSLLRVLLNSLGHEVAKNAYIGFTFLNVKKIKLNEGSRVGHFNVIKKLDTLIIGENALIGNFNWISAFPSDGKGLYIGLSRKCSLILGHESAITHRHYLDCTSAIKIGDFSTVAGYASQFITHGIDIYSNKQDSKEIRIGHHCFVGTRCVLLSGSSLANCSILGAGGVLVGETMSEYSLYGGVPAVEKKKLSKEAHYFLRKDGRVS